ncbi:acetyltransferase [Saccharomonospora sp. NPDC006951]
MDTLTSFSAFLSTMNPGGAALSGPADTFLWIVQGALAIGLVGGNLAAAILIGTGRLEAYRMPAVAALSARMLAFLGISHVAGGLGVVLPQLTGVLPWLTPVAGFALATQALMASGFHLRAGEEAREPALWGALFTVVALGRIDLLGFASPIPGTALVVTICALLVALTVNLVLLLRGPRNPFRTHRLDRMRDGVRIRESLGEVEYPRLVSIWRSAVDATHDFLADDHKADIERRMAAEYLPRLRVVVAERDGVPLGFAATASGKLEMLFVDAAHRGGGIGTALLEYVIAAHDVTVVDVNEQNPQATGFYSRHGFEVAERSDVDDQGRPYPLLHLVLAR